MLGTEKENKKRIIANNSWSVISLSYWELVWRGIAGPALYIENAL